MLIYYFPLIRVFFLFVSQLCFLRVGLCYIPIEPSTLIYTIPIIYLILYNKSDSLEQKNLTCPPVFPLISRSPIQESSTQNLQ